MNVQIDTKFGGFMLRYGAPEGTAESLIRAVKADESDFQKITEVAGSPGSCDLWDLVAYSAQNNNWYEDMKIRVSCVDENGQLIAEDYSEAFAVTDYFCEEKTREIKGRKPHVFSFTNARMMYIPQYSDELDSLSVIFEDEGVRLNADYYDQSGKKKEIGRNLTQKETETLLCYLEEGQLVRKKVNDPSIMILDGGTPATYQLTLKDGDRLEERWYIFHIEKSRQDELMAFLLSLCR